MTIPAQSAVDKLQLLSASLILSGELRDDDDRNIARAAFNMLAQLLAARNRVSYDGEPAPQITSDEWADLVQYINNPF